MTNKNSTKVTGMGSQQILSFGMDSKKTEAPVKTEVKEKSTVAAPVAKKAEKETTVKETAKKTTAKTTKKEVKVEAFVEYEGKQISEKEIIAAVKKAWTKEFKKKVGDLKNMSLYIKPEDNAVYYVINGEDRGKVIL